MKKLFIVFIVFIVFILLSMGTVVAAQWDNKLSYENQDLTVNFSNSFLGLIKTTYIGSATLKSHNSVNEIKNVSIGEGVVMWYDFDFVDLYAGGLGNVSFKNVESGQSVQRNYSFVYQGEETRQVTVQDRSHCKNGGLGAGNNCVPKDKLESYVYKGWLPYTGTDIPKGKIQIGIEVSFNFHHATKSVSRLAAHTECLLTFFPTIFQTPSIWSPRLTSTSMPICIFPLGMSVPVYGNHPL